MQLRQVALVARKLEPVRQQIFQLLGVTSDFADEGVGAFGLKNSVIAVGKTFLEIVAPVAENTTAERLLNRRGGDGGYMVLAQVDDIEPVSERINALGIRKVWVTDRDDVSAFHVHPKDIGAAIVSFDQMRPSEEWLWAGPGWRDRRAANVTTISGTTIQAVDPEDIAGRWSRAFDIDIDFADGRYILNLNEGEISVIEAVDGRGDGVAAVQFDSNDLGPLQAAADRLGLTWNDDELSVCGTQFKFRSRGKARI